MATFINCGETECNYNKECFCTKDIVVLKLDKKTDVGVKMTCYEYPQKKPLNRVEEMDKKLVKYIETGVI